MTDTNFSALSQRNDSVPAIISLRAADRHQLMCWAEALELTPEALLARLADTHCGGHGLLPAAPELGLEIVDGAIKTLVLDAADLPLAKFDWVEGLGIETLVVLNRLPAWLPERRLPSLRHLSLAGLALDSLDLTPVPNLVRLQCTNNALTSLDLAAVPRLEWLDCSYCQLRELELGWVPQLRVLHCEANRLQRLALASVPRLEVLACSKNAINTLDLAVLTRLRRLACRNNAWLRLRLAAVCELRGLDCDLKQLTLAERTTDAVDTEGPHAGTNKPPLSRAAIGAMQGA